MSGPPAAEIRVPAKSTRGRGPRGQLADCAVPLATHKQAARRCAGVRCSAGGGRGVLGAAAPLEACREVVVLRLRTWKRAWLPTDGGHQTLGLFRAVVCVWPRAPARHTTHAPGALGAVLPSVGGGSGVVGRAVTGRGLRGPAWQSGHQLCLVTSRNQGQRGSVVSPRAQHRILQR